MGQEMSLEELINALSAMDSTPPPSKRGAPTRAKKKTEEEEMIEALTFMLMLMEEAQPPSKGSNKGSASSADDDLFALLMGLGPPPPTRSSPGAGRGSQYSNDMGFMTSFGPTPTSSPFSSRPSSQSSPFGSRGDPFGPGSMGGDPFGSFFGSPYSRPPPRQLSAAEKEEQGLKYVNIFK